jgi:hypothetical protein
MQGARVSSTSLVFLAIVLMTTAFTNVLPPLAIALLDGRTHDQAHDTGYIDWSGSVQYVYMTHRDSSSLPPEEGSIPCGSGCAEWVTRMGNGGAVSGSFDRDVTYFEVMVASSHDSSVGNATLRACSAVRTADMYGGPGAGLPGFVSLILSVPAGCRSWSLSASGGYIDFRSTDVVYGAPPPPPTNTATSLPSVTPSVTRTPTLTPTSTSTLTPTFTPTSTATPTQTPTNTPSPTPTPLPPVITGQVVCDLWGAAGWCRGNESLELIASDPQGFDVTISGDLNGTSFTCGISCSVPLPEGIGTANYFATSTSGTTANGSSAWQRDSTPPVLNVVLPLQDGRNGWFVSEVDVTVNASDATSGLYSVAGSIDQGASWNSFPIHLTNGIHAMVVRARDIAGNEARENKVIQIDTVPPVSQITSHVNGQIVKGIVLLRGKLEDQTSGAVVGEISFNSGATWQALSIATGNAWSFTWNTNEMPNGQYTTTMRGIDQAGNVGDVTSITLVIDNEPPHVSLTDRWWIWESGQLRVSRNYFEIAKVSVTISDPQERWPAVVINLDPNKPSASISWNRHLADGTLAPPGEYRVIAVACDIHNLCGSDQGTIAIPSVATSTATMTPSPTATVTMTPPALLTATHQPSTVTPVFAVPTPVLAPAPPQSTYSAPLWQVAGLLGLFLAVASASVIDPRPFALGRLKESVHLILSQQKELSDDNK